MNAPMKRTVIALAVATLFGSTMAYANEDHGHGHPSVDSAATASVDNDQKVAHNVGVNDKLSNTSSIDSRTASQASGNIGMNVAAGDNNAQDNAAALAATDASFAFGVSASDVDVEQGGWSNATVNQGVTNTATVTDNAFRRASGNIGVNVASGNNNEQKNALAASVSTSRFAHANVDVDQNSGYNVVSNAGRVERYDDTTTVHLSGTVQGYSVGLGLGGYAGSTSGSYAGTTSSDSRGSAYQASNFYPDSWDGDTHPSGFQTGHVDFDSEAQGAVQNPYRPGVGGLGFDTASHSTGTESGSMQGSEQGGLGFVELSANDLFADLCGTVTTSRYVVVDATNDASLSGNAFQHASGNIGVNVASGTGNLQANSLSLAVSQPSVGGGGGGGSE